MSLFLTQYYILIVMRIEDLKPPIRGMSEANYTDVEKVGVFPEGTYLTTNRIEFFNVGGEWVLPKNPRMDGVVKSESGLTVVEGNKLNVGDRLVYGSTEDGSEGIYVTSFPQQEKGSGFGFMSSEVSRERRVNYSDLARVLKNAKKGGGKLVWVLGPAVVHAGGIRPMEWLIQNGYVGALLGGNAIAVHDLEHSMFGTSLGMKDNLEPAKNAHRKHLEAINAVREAGSIESAVEQGIITEGIMYECVKNNVPYVLTASIRDDGPLPDTITDNLQAQNAMREQTIQASGVVMIASVLHSVATGNMTPTYRVVGDEIGPIPVIAVDSEEFAVTKLVDRGTSQAYPVVTNAADFLDKIVTELQKA